MDALGALVEQPPVGRDIGETERHAPAIDSLADLSPDSLEAGPPQPATTPDSPVIA